MYMFDKYTDFDIDLDYLNDEYREAVKALSASIKAAETTEKKKEFFNKFAEKFTVIPPLWSFYIRKIEGINNETDPRYYPIHLRATLDFYDSYLLYYSKDNSEVKIQNYRNFFNRFSYWTKIFGGVTEEDTYFSLNCYPERYLKNRSFAIKIFDDLITFPHRGLEEAYEKLQQYSDHPISKELIKKYETAKELIKKWNAKDFEYDWIEHSFEFGLRYAIQTFEFSLCYQYGDVEIWKKYIAALKSRNIKVMLQVMLKYIRLFVSDTEMQENYEKERSEAKNIPGFDDLPDLQSYLFDDPFVIEDAIEYLRINYFTNFENLQQQHLPFKLPLINYLLKNGDPLILHKLQKSCRFFSSRKAMPVCHQLILSCKFNSSRYDTQSLKVKVNENGHIEDHLFEVPAQIFNNLHVSNRLSIKTTKISFCASKLVLKLYKCDARYLELHRQNLTWREFDFLTSSKKLKNLIFNYTNVYEDELNIAPLENVVAKLSGVSSIEILNYKNITPKTCEILASMDLNCKLDFFGLGHFVAENFNIEEYAKFIEKHVKEKSVFEITYAFDPTWGDLWEATKNADNLLRQKFKGRLDFGRRNSHYCARIDLDFI